MISPVRGSALWPPCWGKLQSTETCHPKVAAGALSLWKLYSCEMGVHRPLPGLQINPKGPPTQPPISILGFWSLASPVSAPVLKAPHRALWPPPWCR